MASTRGIRATVRCLLSVALLMQPSDFATAQPKDVPFTQVTIDADPPSRPWYKMVGDISGDGFADIVVAGSKGPMIAYVYPDWTKIPIADGGWNGVNGEIADLDGDQDADIVMGGVVWFENPGSDGGKWQRHRIDNQKAHDIELADLDSDGRMDVVARDQSAFGKNGNKIFIYHQQEAGKWSRQVIDCPHGEGLKLGDLDADGDADIIIGALWYENPRNRSDRWVEHCYTSQWTEPDAKVEMADINGDGRPDIVLTPAELAGETYKVCWYQAPADPKASDWTERVIIDSIECVIHALGVGDLDGDGASDIALAEMHQGKDPDEVFVLLNADNGASWRKQILSNRGSHGILLTDIENDGDLDIIGANPGGAHPLQWWRNERIAAQKR